MSVEQRGRIDFKSSLFFPEERGVKGELLRVLEEAARVIALDEGLEYSQLGKRQQLVWNVKAAGFLHQIAVRDYNLGTIEKRMVPDERRICVNPRTIELTVVGDSRQKSLLVAPERKVMLALLADFTLQKVGRCLQPWIHLDDFVDFSQEKYSRNQAHEKLFEFSVELGILKVNQSSGYCLNCDPEALLALLQGSRREYSLEINSEWCDFKTLLEDYLLPVVQAVWEQKSQGEEKLEERLDTERLAELTGRYQDTVYLHLNRLEEVGLILRRNNLYHLEDIAWEIIKEIIQANAVPYSPRVMMEKFVFGEKELERKKPARKEPLYTHRQEYPNYPQVSWGKYDLKVDFEGIVPEREDKLKLIKQILSTDLVAKTVLDSKRKPISFDGEMPVVFKLPSSEEIPTEQAIAVLNFLGFGPKETVKFIGQSDRTLEETIVRLESEEPIFADTVKARLAGLLMDNVVTPFEARDFPFTTDIKQWLAQI